MRAPLKQLHDGEWETPVAKGYLMQCCRCGLRHKVNFRVRKRSIQFQATRVRRS